METDDYVDYQKNHDDYGESKSIPVRYLTNPQFRSEAHQESNLDEYNVGTDDDYELPDEAPCR